MYNSFAQPNNTMGYAPQGVVGDLLSGLAPTIGTTIGSTAGNQQLGTQLGNVAAELAKYLPFSAIPTAQPMPQLIGGDPRTYSPQGIFGDLIASTAPTIGTTVGDWAGNQQLGTSIGNVASQVAKYLPFSATPTAFQPPPFYTPIPQSYAPQGIFGSLLGGPLGNTVGGQIGDWLGNRQLGESLGSTIGGVAGDLLPFSAIPNPYFFQGALPGQAR
jgi:hypothetical protein